MDRTKNLVGEALSKLAQQLEAGHSDQMRAYLAAMSRFRNYSVGNMLLILAERPDATHVAGYRAWMAMGRHVRQGERGITIAAPCVRRRRQEGANEAEEEEVYAFRRAHVFDVSQTEGRSLPQPPPASGEPGEHLARLKALVGSRGIELAYSTALGSAQGMAGGNRITLKSGLAAAEEFSTLCHELSHLLLHTERNNGQNKMVRETEAEAVAFVVCHAVGLDSIVASGDYIRLYGGSKDALLASLNRIRATAFSIIDGVLGEGGAKCRDEMASTEGARVSGVEDSSGGDESWPDCA